MNKKIESYGLIGSRLENSMQRAKIYWVEPEAYCLVKREYLNDKDINARQK